MKDREKFPKIEGQVCGQSLKKSHNSSIASHSLNPLSVEPQLSVPLYMKKLAPRKRKGEVKNRSSIRKAESLHTNPLKCSLTSKTPLFLLNQKGDFHNKQIKNLRTKEQLIVAKRLKSISHQMQAWVQQRLNHKVTHQTEDHSHKKEESPLKLEERHFLIDRVIRYLTDV